MKELSWKQREEPSSSGVSAGSARGYVLHHKFVFAFLLFWPCSKLQAPGCLAQHVQKKVQRGICGKPFPSMEQLNIQTASSAGSHWSPAPPAPQCSCNAAVLGQGRLASAQGSILKTWYEKSEVSLGWSIPCTHPSMLTMLYKYFCKDLFSCGPQRPPTASPQAAPSGTKLHGTKRGGM